MSFHTTQAQNTLLYTEYDRTIVNSIHQTNILEYFETYRFLLENLKAMLPFVTDTVLKSGYFIVERAVVTCLLCQIMNMGVPICWY